MKIHDLFGHQPDPRTFLPDVNIPTNRCVGIEVEVENAAAVYQRRYKYWAVKHDGSLRNDGAELLLRHPLAGNDLRKSLHELAGIFHEHPEIHISDRTSVHIHVDVRDLSTEQLSRLLTAYVASESGLYKLGGKTRYDNIYCPGVTAALEQMSLMRKIVRPDSSDQFAAACHEWCKYTGINFRSITERGSVEFRAHEGTVDVGRIRDWVSVLLLLVRYAEEKVTSVDAVAADAYRGPQFFAERVFGHKANIILEDGVYEQFYKNNIINLIDLLRDKKEYKPERAKGAEAPATDFDELIAQIEENLLTA